MTLALTAEPRTERSGVSGRPGGADIPVCPACPRADRNVCPTLLEKAAYSAPLRARLGTNKPLRTAPAIIASLIGFVTSRSLLVMSALTLTERILARHADRNHVVPGDNIWIDVDILMTHDVCGPGTIGIFKQHFGQGARVWDRDKVVIIPDHYIFTADKMANRNVDVLRAFVQEQKLPHYYDVGTDRYKGVCHIALPEEGHTRPGEVLFGTDSHTC